MAVATAITVRGPCLRSSTRERESVPVLPSSQTMLFSELKGVPRHGESPSVAGLRITRRFDK